MSRVIAVPENDPHGPYIGFRVDNEMLECNQCTHPYRLRYTEDQEKNLAKHRAIARRQIHTEHPKHRDDLEIPT
jgi:hypothetical protein